MQKKLHHDLQEAMRAKDSARLSVLRMVISALQGKQIEKRAKTGDQSITLSEDEVIAVLRQEAKKRTDSVQQFTAADRAELAKKEKSELEIIQQYLPKELSDEELEKIVKNVCAGFGEASEKEFGKIMGAVMKETKGLASGDRISALVKKILQK